MRYIVDDIGEVVTAMKNIVAPATADSTPPYYMYGHRREISNRLTAKDNDKVFKYQKYPLIALKMDIPEAMKEGLYTYTLNIAILTNTSKVWNAEKRMFETFKPILYPLLVDFFTALRNSGLFTWPGDMEYPEHTKIDRPFWGTAATEGNEKQLFNDPIDAIELIDLRITSTNKTC